MLLRAAARSSRIGRPTVLNTLGVAPNRGVLPVAAIAAGAVKFGAAAVLKKIALTKVVQKVGPERALTELRGLNQKLKGSGVKYSGEVASAADASLNTLEKPEALRSDSGVAWAWYSTLEKENPTLAAAVLQRLDTLPGVGCLCADERGAKKKAAVDASSSSGNAAVKRRSLEARSDEERRQFCRRSERAIGPREGHIVLIPKEGWADVRDAWCDCCVKF